MALLSLQLAFPTDEPADGSDLRFGLTNEHGGSKVVSGVRAMEQHVAKLLLTTLGTDFFNFDAGTALAEIAKEPVTKDNLLSLRNDLTLSVAAVENQILNSQDGLVLDDAETLVSIGVQSIEYQEGLGWAIDLRLNMADGNIGRLALGA